MAAYTIDDPRDEGPLADLTSAGMWTTAGLIGASMFLLPGAPHEHIGVGLLIAAAAITWGAISLLLLAQALDDADRPARRRHRRHGAARDRRDLGFRRRHELPAADAAVHGAVHLVLLPLDWRGR